MANTLEISTRIHQHGSWLDLSVLDLADSALSDHDAERHRECAGATGVCLEGVLRAVLKTWRIEPAARATLGELIGALRSSGRAPESLLDRLGTANQIRIRAAHHAPDRWDQVGDGDTLLMLNVLDMLVAWAGEHVHGDGPVPPDGLPIFVSVGSCHLLQQEMFLRHVRAELHSLGCEQRGLNSTKYSEERPIDQVRELLGECAGALVIGLERSHAYAVFEREQSRRQKVYSDQYIPTAWNQIEGAMASALGLPVLVLKERRLHAEGIFEADNHRHRREIFDLGTEAASLSAPLRSVLASWIGHVRDRARTP